MSGDDLSLSTFLAAHPHLQLMVQGTTSDAGKSTLVCALGRIFADKGVAVAPFKPQNMALNSAVTDDGGEIGRAQALQALACRIAPHTDMNPVLLKPNSETGSQVIIQGQVIGNQHALVYQDYKKVARDAVMTSYRRLQQRYAAIITEGAGSPAEINLRAGDIANMGFAEEADCPVILIADIDRGGVFAHIIGTLACLSASERQRVIGFVINRFRGDLSLLQSGLDWLEQETGKPVLGVLPYLQGLYLDAEDSLSLHQTKGTGAQQLNVVVPAYPRISNHTDLDALRIHPQVNLILVGPGQTPPPADLIILPGSKNTRADLQWLLTQSADWQDYIHKHPRYGGRLMGICGGLQMLGRRIHDPHGSEGEAGSSDGLNLLPIDTELTLKKTLTQQHGCLKFPSGNKVDIQGYEIHTGLSHAEDLIHTGCGWLSEDEQIFATYWHGLLDTPDALSEILQWAGLSDPSKIDFYDFRDKQINRLANETSNHLDWKKLDQAIKNFYNTLSAE